MFGLLIGGYIENVDYHFVDSILYILRITTNIMNTTKNNLKQS